MTWTVRPETDHLGRYFDVFVPAGNYGRAFFRMREIRLGSFTMGSPKTEKQRQVALTKKFWMSDAPCTQMLYEAVMVTNPSRFACPGHPVENVSWDDAQAFLDAINANMPSLQLRLPTEAEWEYACRAGTIGTRYEGDVDAIAWYSNNAGGHTHAVRQKRHNRWGLYDMLGNVWEWCQDWYGPSTYEYCIGIDGHIIDPRGPPKGTRRVLRGGSWISFAQHVQAAARHADRPSYAYDSFGFRFVATDLT